MNILIANDCGVPPEYLGGIEAYTNDLATVLQEYGYDVKLICPSRCTNKENYNYSLNTIKPFGNFWNNRIEFRTSYYVLYKRLYKSIRQLVNTVDVIHAHNPYSAGLAGSMISHNYDKPAVMTFHLNITNFLGKKNLTYHERVANTSLANYKKFIVNTNTLKNALIERFKLDSNLIKVINPYADTERFNPAISGESIREKLKISINGIVLLFVGRMVSTKNLYDLFKAIQHIKDDNIFCLLVGSGPLEKDLKKYCVKNNMKLDRKIFFLDRVTAVDLPQYYAACDIFVSPSISEGFGLTFLEAWSSGKPVIGSDMAIIKNEVIKDGINGLIFKAGDFYSLADKISMLVNDQQIRETLGRNGRSLVEANYSKEKFLREHLSLYEEITKR